MWTCARYKSTLLFVSVISLVGLFSSPVLAARGTLDYETIKKTNALIILAEVVEAKDVTRSEPRDPSRIDNGYAITLKVHEVLRGDLKAKTIQIPFSSKGYARTWEYDSPPKEGMKLLVFLESGQDDKWNDYGIPDTIRPIETFDAAPVKTLRRILELWAIAPEQKQEKALREGCLGDDLGFRLYCIGVMDGRGLKQDAEAPDVLSFLWEVYTDPRVDIDTWQACDNTFQNAFRSFGWRTYEPRYAILIAVVERTWKDKDQSPTQSLNSALLNLTAYSSHRAQTLELFLTLTSGAREDVAGSAALYMSFLYEFFPRTEDEKALNTKLLAKLVELMAKGTSSSDMAAAGVADLVRKTLKLGITREDLAQLVRNSVNKDYPKATKDRLATGLRDLEAGLQKMKPMGGDKELPIVGKDLQSHVGKLVRVVGRASWERTSEYGVALEIPLLIWLPELKKWPFDFPPDNYIVATGELGQKEDIPVFRYEKGKPFGRGLPVPQPYSLKDMSRRFVLENAKWEIIEKP